MKTAQQWFDEYGVSHQNPTNKRIHWICVPAIFFSIAGLLTAIPDTWLNGSVPRPYAPYVNVASLVMVPVLIFYLRLSFTLFIGMLLFSAFTVWANVQLLLWDLIPLWLLSIVIFVVAWIGQFIGHNIEGAKPSFFKDIQFLLIGPAWLMSFIYRSVGLRY